MKSGFLCSSLENSILSSALEFTRNHTLWPLSQKGCAPLVYYITSYATLSICADR